MNNFLKNAVLLSHKIIEELIRPGDIVVDATCGRGYDSLFLANLIGETGRVFCFDIQKEALESTGLLLANKGLDKRAELILDSHEKLKEYIKVSPAVFMFNLGYLPSGDHNITTMAKSTVQALQAALEILAESGVISLVSYSGHPGGKEEQDALIEYLGNLDQKVYEVLETRFINQFNNPAVLYIIFKSGGKK